MKHISTSDKLFVTVICNGHRLLNISISGFNSMKEVIKYLRSILRDYAGKLLTLQLRNSTRGWNQTDSMLFAS